MTARVVFLDIDGVICTRRAAGWPRWTARQIRGRRPAVGRGRPARALDPLAIARLNQLTETAACVVVVSSNWRLDRDVAGLLQAAGFRGAFHLDWRTDDLGPTRGHEIARWLSAHGEPDFIIIDDKGDAALPQMRGRLVQPAYYDGFQAAHLARCRTLFGLDLIAEGGDLLTQAADESVLLSGRAS